MEINVGDGKSKISLFSHFKGKISEQKFSKESRELNVAISQKKVVAKRKSRK